MVINKKHLSEILFTQFQYYLLADRTFESLTIKELNQLSSDIADKIQKENDLNSEPPF